MTRKKTFLGGKLLLATIVATGAAAAPAALDSDLVPQLNSANAADNGFAEERMQERLTPTPVDGDNIYRLLGTTRDEVQRETAAAGTYTESGPLAEYQHEVESGNLQGAASALAAVSNRPITENLVDEVNRELGVETRLTIQQIADTAAAMQEPAAGEMEPKAAFMDPEETADNVYALLGTTPEEARAAMIRARPTTGSGPLRAYQHAVESGNLGRAAKALAAVSKVPITEDLVNSVNLALGVETRLTAKQLASTAAAEQ